MKSPLDEDELLGSLAVAMYENPRGTMQELAKAANISKATLHRFCGSRDNLEQMINHKALLAISEIQEIAETQTKTDTNLLTLLIQAHMKNLDILRLYTTKIPCTNNEMWLPFLKSIDTFFLNGQKKGTFRIDLSAQTLTEIFESTLCAVYDGVKRGRIAQDTASNSVETFFLQGAAN
jgi:TetR/AcrR family transcriptional repressor of mexCD-oprJ operon